VGEAVCQSGFSDAVFSMAGAEKDCEREGQVGLSQCCWLCWSITQRKYPRWRGEGNT